MARLSAKEAVDPQCLLPWAGELNSFQKSVLSFLLVDSDIPGNAKLAAALAAPDSKPGAYLRGLFPDRTAFDPGAGANPRLMEILRRIKAREPLGPEPFSYVMNGIMSGLADDWFVGFFLALVYTRGLCDQDVYAMTMAMCDTGKVYDYRELFPGKKVLRRYPTGALSEKVALLLPSMLSAVSEHYPVVSPFIVAKSLSFTGGTWSKLSAIRGFSFPAPGAESAETMRACGAAMTVAHHDLCPVDTILYQVRGFTGTVDSLPLATASIAAKQLACPADLLLLDVRFGEGAFFQEPFARDLLAKIQAILEKSGLGVMGVMTDTRQPSGCSIGNHLELCEAIAIMKNEAGIFDPRALHDQTAILLSFFAKLLSSFFYTMTETEWAAYGRRLITGGAALESFRKLCAAHGVAGDETAALLADPIRYFGLREVSKIRARADGVLGSINQKKLGNISNFRFSSRAGIGSGIHKCLNLFLHKRLSDVVRTGDPLCTVFSVEDTSPLDAEAERELYSCFELRQSGF
jgi:thymidine phosphorylase